MNDKHRTLQQEIYENLWRFLPLDDELAAFELQIFGYKQAKYLYIYTTNYQKAKKNIKKSDKKMSNVMKCWKVTYYRTSEDGLEYDYYKDLMFGFGRSGDRFQQEMPLLLKLKSSFLIEEKKIQEYKGDRRLMEFGQSGSKDCFAEIPGSSKGIYWEIENDLDE